ncbi:MAG: hypothetical protein ACKVT0_08870 [Planctomycetaceae bacterium]
MYFLIGCSGVMALIAFLVGFAVSLFVRDASWIDRLTMAVMSALITFVAVFLLSSRDWVKRRSTMKSVRNHLLARDDTTNNEFLSSIPYEDVALLLETRKAISRFFDVPIERVGRDLQLIHDLHVDEFEPFFQFSVVNSVIASQQIEPKAFGFTIAGLETIDDLTHAIRNVLDGFERNTV